MPYRILHIILVLIVATASVHAQPTPNLVVAWVENGDLRVWHTADDTPTRYTSGSARHPFISPDGQYIAFTTTTPSSLWLLNPQTSKRVEVVPNTALAATDSQFYIMGDLQWGANNTLYFNTYKLASHMMTQMNDLWSVDAATHTFQQLSPASQGGKFTRSPNDHYIAIVQPGTYDGTPGSIRLLEAETLRELTLLNFPAVSTASDYDFYSNVYWETDSRSLKVAVPDEDLIYDDNSALTTLWRLGVDGTTTSIGTVQASFFGQLEWSTNTEHLGYVRRKGALTDNLLDIIIADGDGSNPSIYASDTTGRIGLPQWLPNSDQFIYSQGEPGDYWLGQPGQPPQALPGKIFNPHFIDSTTYVYTTAPSDTFELRYTQLSNTSSTIIATISNPIPLFDAVLVP